LLIGIGLAGYGTKYHLAAGKRLVSKDKRTISPTVYIVDDDRDVRLSISFMLGAADIESRPFGGGADLLDALVGLEPGCILLDIRMPQMDGFQLMAALAERGIDWPIVVMTGHGEVSVAVRAMKLGAIDFLEKPFSEEALFGCFTQAFALLEERLESGQRKRAAKERIEQLTNREAEVLKGLLCGASNKKLAQDLGISLRTVEMHRGNMMERLKVGSLAEALTLAIDAGIQPVHSDAA
jgi:two-component system response regulator FixJ